MKNLEKRLSSFDVSLTASSSAVNVNVIDILYPLALARGSAWGVLFFMIKQKIIRDKMRYSNLSNNMMISEL
jgi:hypothetical protein